MATLFDDLPLLPAAGANAPSGPAGGDGRGSEEGEPSEGAPSAGARRGSRRIDPEALLEGLNPQQRAAVVHDGSALLIVAGAGSGKTRVLTHRIAYLLAARNVHPGSILAITFTNKAAGEMRSRVEALVGPRAKVMWVSTFHSACVRILRREAKRLGFSTSFSIYDQADAQRLMGLVCRDLDLDPKRYPPRSFSAQVSNLKNDLVDHETFAGEAKTHVEQVLAEAYALYQRRLREANALDFDDLIMTTVDLLRVFPDAAEHYRRRFRHVLVDEYQDTNHAQYALVRELVGGSVTNAERRTVDGDLVREASGPQVPPASLCVVGDADQSIYAFRGATIRNILQFEADYPDATTILLEQNYRSTQTILSAANAVIARNADRKPKNLWSEAGAGSAIVGYVADNEHDEASFVAQEVDRLSDDALAKPRDIAVFYRTNAQSRVFEEVFIRVGLPYKVVGGVASTSAARSATPWPTSGCSRTPTTRCRCVGSSTCPSAASATGPRPASRPSRRASGSRSRRRCGAARRPPASRPGRSRRSPGSAGWSTTCAPWWSPARTPRRCSRRCWSRPAISTS
jgi:DNA helicase-2/ATP-dependent DNA helicase PcrA